MYEQCEHQQLVIFCQNNSRDNSIQKIWLEIGCFKTSRFQTLIFMFWALKVRRMAHTTSWVQALNQYLIAKISYLELMIRVIMKRWIMNDRQTRHLDRQTWWLKEFFRWKWVTVVSGPSFISSKASRPKHIFVKKKASNPQPRILCNGNGAISHLQTEMGFFKDFRYSLYNW